jgi:hypothetical protein
MEKKYPPQQINKLDVTVRNGNFNIEIAGVVGENARIALHDKDSKLDFDAPLSSSDIVDFFKCEILNAESDFRKMEITGKNWINYNASSGQRIVIWDSMPGDPTMRPRYVCQIPDSIPGKITYNELSTTLASKKAHFSSMQSFRVFLNNSNWNIIVDGSLTSKGWIGLYQDGSVDDRTTWEYASKLEGGKAVIHPETSFTLYLFVMCSLWFSGGANTDCYFKIFDKNFNMDERVRRDDWNEVKERYVYYISDIIEVDEQL